MSFVSLKDVKVDDEFAPIPAGKYTLRCNEAEVKDTKAGTGRYIKCQFKTEENRVVWHLFNIENPNPKAVEIGLGQLKRFLKGAGYHDPEELGSLNDLIGLKAECTVKIDKSEQYGDKNVISGFSVKKKQSAEKDDVPF
jgi:hypothetical protein